MKWNCPMPAAALMLAAIFPMQLLLQSPALTSVSAFTPMGGAGTRTHVHTRSHKDLQRMSRTQRAESTRTAAFWRHWIPEPDRASNLLVETDDWSTNVASAAATASNDGDDSATAAATTVTNTLLIGLMIVMSSLCMPSPAAMAVSGGGLDYAGLDISGQEFSSSTAYKGKDFTQVIAKNTNFAHSNLQGCRFYKAYLVNTNFEGADLRGASLEDTSMDGANMKDTIAIGSYFSKSILDVANLENADFTDAQFPLKTQPLLCQRDDLKGTNPVTGADTRESAMCL